MRIYKRNRMKWMRVFCGGLRIHKNHIDCLLYEHQRKIKTAITLSQRFIKFKTVKNDALKSNAAKIKSRRISGVLIENELKFKTSSAFKKWDNSKQTLDICDFKGKNGATLSRIICSLCSDFLMMSALSRHFNHIFEGNNTHFIYLNQLKKRHFLAI